MAKTKVVRKKSLSQRQVSTLRYIHRFRCTVDTLRSAHQGTIWSLLYGGYVELVGDGDLRLTGAGDEQIRGYAIAALSERQREADLTVRVSRLLYQARRRRAA